MVEINVALHRRMTKVNGTRGFESLGWRTFALSTLNDLFQVCESPNDAAMWSKINPSLGPGGGERWRIDGVDMRHQRPRCDRLIG